MQRLKWWLFIAGICPALAFASTQPDHTDPVAFVLLGVTTIFSLQLLVVIQQDAYINPAFLGNW